MSDRESTVEDYLVEQCKAHGILTRKVTWIGRSKAMDRLLVFGGRVVFVEVKSEECGPKFPSNGHELAQRREHDRFKLVGADVRVVWSKPLVDVLIAEMVGG
jgi:hypothetical protein